MASDTRLVPSRAQQAGHRGDKFVGLRRSRPALGEIGTLLKANGTGEWISESINQPNWKRWRRVDGTLVGLYDAKRHFLYISSKSFYDAQGAKLEKESHTQYQAADHRIA